MEKITQTALAIALDQFSGVRIFLLSKISDLCSHLSLGARRIERGYRPAKKKVKNDARK